jgi:diaminopimelate decarboxylase
MINDSIRYQDGVLHCDAVPLPQIAAQVGTPTYIYSLKRALANYRRIKTAFAVLKPDVHYSAKANGNLTLLKTLIEAGAGIDAVSAGEIYRALSAGAQPQHIVFAGVGKTSDELRYAVQQGVGWFNVENVEECALLNQYAAEQGRTVRIALRLNPDVTANTHPYIATGHGAAKFGLTAEVVQSLLASQAEYPSLEFAGIHLHIGSQLHDVDATAQAVQTALDIIEPYPNVKTLNIGGGLPVAYDADTQLPDFTAFANALAPLLVDYQVILEPGRSIIADAGILLTRVLYLKQQAGQQLVVVDASMTELIRPALYEAHHEIVTVKLDEASRKIHPVNVVGPVCESSDVLGMNVQLPDVQVGDLLAILTAGAYGMVMASNYNARTRPAEIVVEPDGQIWRIARQRETWEDLIRLEQ